MPNYIPPHKRRQLKAAANPLEESSSNSRSVSHRAQHNLNLAGSYNCERITSNGENGKYAYAKSCLSKLCGFLSSSSSLLLGSSLSIFREKKFEVMPNYIPPHKRPLKNGAKPLEESSLNSRSFSPTFQRNMNLSGSYNSERVMWNGENGRCAYAKSCISKLCVLDSAEQEKHQYPGVIRLKQISKESILYKELEYGAFPYVLVSSHKEKGTNELNKNNSAENPLISVAKEILPNLLAFQKERVEGKEFQVGKVCFVARFGKILFHNKPWFNGDTLRGRSEYEASLSQMKRVFNTSVPKSFIKSVLNVVVTEMGVDLGEEKEYYYVRLADKSRPDVSLYCKCTATGVGGLKLQKVETNSMRHVQVDIACVRKDLDLRLMLSTRNVVTEPTDEEKHDLEKVIKSAVVDENEKGGLRFPLGSESFEGRYRVVGIGHQRSRALKYSSIKIKLYEGDRYNFTTSTAVETNHVVLKMTGITEKLKDNKLEREQLVKMLEDNMKIIWNHLLSLECRFT